MRRSPLQSSDISWPQSLSLREWVSEWVVRAIILTAIVGILGPLFVESLASLPVLTLTQEQLPVYLVAFAFGLILPLLHAAVTKLSE